MLFSCYFNKHIKHELKNYEKNKKNKKIYIKKLLYIYFYLVYSGMSPILSKYFNVHIFKC